MNKKLIRIKTLIIAATGVILTLSSLGVNAQTAPAEPVHEPASHSVAVNVAPVDPDGLALGSESARLLAVAQSGDVEAYLALGNLYMAANKDEQGLGAFEQAYKLADNGQIKRSALFNKGNALVRLSRFQEAEMAFSECLALDPADTAPAFSLAGLHMRQGNYEMALEWLDSVSADYALETSFLRCRLHILLKDAAAGNKSFAEARRVLDEEAGLDSENRIELLRALEEMAKELASLK